MFAEDVILSALKEVDHWFVADYLLLHGNYGEDAAAIAREIADRNELRMERIDDHDQVRHGYKFWRIK